MPERAVVLLSGGLDSATCLALVQQRGLEVCALTVDYGQRHRLEIERARTLARARSVRDHRVVQLDLRSFGGSALTSAAEVPKDRPLDSPEIPITYVPARNAILLSLALGCAEAIQASEVHIGVTAVDGSGYPDCRPEFIEAFQAMADRATRAAVAEGRRIQIWAPLIRWDKAQIIRTGVALGLDYGLTHSCYDPDPEGLACGHCDACHLRRRGFEQAGVPDPTRYVAA
jgi:7-cyano-7-deazaguanine synthase